MVQQGHAFLLSKTPAQAASSGLSTVSLVLGVFSLLFGPLAGILAIITGHLALRRIRKSRGALQGRGNALIGLVLGYVMTALFANAGFAAIARARKVTVLSTATAIESAVNNYYTEYGTMPINEPSDTTITTSKDAAFLHVLLGLESKVNLRAVKFLSAREGKDNKNGLIYGKDGKSVVGLFDPWGGGYHVRLDLDLDEKISVNGKVLENRRVAVWSDGPDRKPGTADDIKTWE